MDNMILIDIETRDFDVYSGIYEVASLVVSNGEIIDELHLGIVENPELVPQGYGYGYSNISENKDIIDKFQGFINKYNFPLVAHNASFDRKFLVHYSWITEEYPVYDSIRAIKYSNTKLFSYSLSHIKDFIGLENVQTHKAVDDVKMLYEIIKYFNPTIWIPVGKKTSYNGGSSKLNAINEQFEIVKDLFLGKNIVFTGKGLYTRNQLIQLAKKCGADISSNSITKKTNLLVVGEQAGSKLSKAKELGIEIMSMNDFVEMVDGINLNDEQKKN